jgi:hypothetical protein
VIEGEIDPLGRQSCELSLMNFLRRSGIVAEEIEINAAGCFVVVSAHQAPLLAAAVQRLNAAIRRLHPHCVRISFTPTHRGERLPALAELIAAMQAAGIGVAQISSDAAAISVIVDAPDRAGPGSTAGDGSRLRASVGPGEHRIATRHIGLESEGRFAEDVRTGLSSATKRLPTKYLYDELGSALFEALGKVPNTIPPGPRARCSSVMLT